LFFARGAGGWVLGSALRRPRAACTEWTARSVLASRRWPTRRLRASSVRRDGPDARRFARADTLALRGGDV